MFADEIEHSLRFVCRYLPVPLGYVNEEHRNQELRIVVLRFVTGFDNELVALEMWINRLVVH